MELKHLFANGLITFSINGNPVFSNGTESLPRNSHDRIILDNWISDSLISFDVSLAKALQGFATRILVNNNLCETFVSSLGLLIIFDDNFIL